MRQHSVTNKTPFTLLLLLLKEHDSFELRNYVSVAHHLTRRQGRNTNDKGYTKRLQAKAYTWPG
jgi:hypothetical protein